MKVNVLKAFYDIQADADREPGETFECSKERFEEIDAALPGWVEAAPAPKAAPRKRAAKDAEE